MNHTNKKLSDIATLTVNALEELNSEKANKPRYFNITIPVSGWLNDSHDYPKYYDIALENVTEKDRVDIMIAPESMITALDIFRNLKKYDIFIAKRD